MGSRKFPWILAFALLTMGCGGSGGGGISPSSPSNPAASLFPASVDFGNQKVGSASASRTVTLTNSGNATLSISKITASGDFIATNNCGASLAAEANCGLQVSFVPTATGVRTGKLTVTDNASGASQSVNLSGTGVTNISTALPDSFFGITTNDLTSTNAWPVPLTFETAGKTSSGAFWLNLEPSKGNFNWAPLDDVVDSAQNAGLKHIIYCFFETPQWASSNPTQSCFATQSLGVEGCAAPPANMQDWKDFVSAVVTRYKGKIDFYELWNEPDVESEYSGTIAQMLSMAQSAYSIIKAADPNATVLTPSVSIGGVLSADPNCGSGECWLATYLAAGGGKYADDVTFHGKACDSNTQLCATNQIACPPNAIQMCAGSPLVNQINDARIIMANNGLSARPLVNTEGGFSNDLAINDLPNATADQQAAFVSRFFIIQASENLPVAVYFSWLQNSKLDLTGFGTTSAETETNEAYSRTYSWLAGSTMGGPCTQDTNSVWSCPLTLANNHPAMLVWSDVATSFVPPNTFTSYQDITGVTTPIDGAVNIGIVPILLQ